MMLKIELYLLKPLSSIGFGDETIAHELRENPRGYLDTGFFTASSLKLRSLTYLLILV